MTVFKVHCPTRRRINFRYAGHSVGASGKVLVSVTMAATLAVSQTPKGNTMASALIKHVTDATFEADVLK
ncbi:MAG: hypothetical protein KA254_07145, partial [Rhodoferax sp.]|nr:hypothetical protein [Rhodoferax sp.]